MNRKSGRGKRLIILHAITKDGPLAEIDEATGKPVMCQLIWKGDTPHPAPVKEGDKHTCETFWIASSHTGDYHDNMDSDNFMQWVKEKLVPTFKKNPGHKMVTVLDNAPYHHKRVIGSL